MQPSSLNPENNYMMFDIVDSSGAQGKTLGRIITTWHIVKPEDKLLNSRIMDAVKNACGAFFELPPAKAAGLAHRTFAEIIIDEFNPKDIRLDSSEISDDLLSNIQKSVSKETYQKIEEKAGHLTGDDRLKFLKFMSLFSDQLDEVSLDDFLAAYFLQTHPHLTTIEPLEKRDVIQEAKALSADIPQSLDLAIKVAPSKKDDKAALDLARTAETTDKAAYDAWRAGNVEALRDKYNSEKPPTHMIVHNEIRNKEIAEKIVRTVNGLKKVSAEKAPIFVVGAAHLLDPHTKTVLAYLKEKLPGCNIELNRLP